MMKRLWKVHMTLWLMLKPNEMFSFIRTVVPFIDKKFLIQPIGKVWTTKMQNQAKQEQELTRQVPDGWNER